MSDARASEHDLRGPLDAGVAAVAVLDARGRVVGWSPAARALLGHESAEVTGRPFTDLFAGAGRDGAGDRGGPGGSGGPAELDALAGSVFRVFRLTHRDGRALRVALVAAPLTESAREGAPARIVLMADADDLQAWQTRQAMLRSLVNESPVGLGIYDTSLSPVWVNARAGHELGSAVSTYARVPLDEVWPRGEIISPQHPRTLAEVMRRVLATGEPVIDLHYRAGLPATPQDERVWSCSYFLLRDAAGNALGVCEESVDITDRYAAQERLVLLNEASARIGTTLDATRTAQELAALAVPRLADRVDVHLLREPVEGRDGLLAGDVGLCRAASRTAAGEAVVRGGEVTEPLAASTPAVRCMALGSSLLYATTDPAGRAWRAEFRWVLAVPVRARGTVLDAALFLRAGPEPFADDDRVLAEELVARTGVAVDNARRYTRERDAALTLQRSLLPRNLPERTAVDVAHRYLPSDARAGVGGDWFDVVPLSGTRVALAVGDVVGHGLRAAATMGRLRTTVRALARLDLAPDELLARLDDVVGQSTAEAEEDPSAASAEEGSWGATCLYAVYDPVSGHLTAASAGHPAPVVRTPDARVTTLELEPGPPLGVGGLPFERTEAELPEGSVVALFTDGLVRGVGHDLGAGLDALHDALAADGTEDLDAVCERVVTALPPGPATDDAALLVARTHRLGPDQVVVHDLEADPATVADARKVASRRLERWGMDVLGFTTELIVSELVTNAVRYADGPIQLRLIRDGRTLVCEVSDCGHTSPHLRQSAAEDEGGRGLFLIAQLARHWGTRYTRTGKTIWTEQDLDAPGLDVTG
ncbi:SpoIIE family protein phosphatase [Streptomyces sp. GSL17-111]|uniref:SpoIIE family protein phosphatase n=1 Tax=Streptomyces sp. GSL17-111 TaxID=3121596 RepID=UPI0030F3B049